MPLCLSRRWSALVPLVLVVSCLCLPCPAYAQVTFSGLGYLSGGTFESIAYGVSSDGSVVVGASRGNTSNSNQAFRWTSGTGMTGLGDLAGGTFYSAASAVSADGSTIVGYGNVEVQNQRFDAFRWTSSDGMTRVPDTTNSNSFASAVSADGSTIVGINSGRPFRWSAATGLTVLGGFAATGVSADGSVVIGYRRSSTQYEAFRWTSSEGMVWLGDLPGGQFLSDARGVSADGSLVVGVGHNGGSRAILWRKETGMVNLEDVLRSQYGMSQALNGWILHGANAISADGTTIVGYGQHNGKQEAWRLYNPAGWAAVPEPGTVALAVSGLLPLAGVVVRRRRLRQQRKA